ncbi:aldehyde dehydrogenase family protein [Nocardia tengchongensis]|uniref:aldehyde dehydrogenase family protein n=1 Tax=Nocardia tengchongensis TaxID=2055889 RepID=UPI0033E7D330
MSVTTAPSTYDRVYLGGAWVEPSTTEHFEVENPATEEVAGRIPWVGAADVDKAVAAARAAFPAWSTTSLEQRQEAIRRIAAGLEARADELTVLLAAEMGCPVTFGRTYQVGLGLITLATVPALVEEVRWHTRTENTDVLRVPVGVVGVITPWNYPLHQLIGKVAYAIAAGNTVVVKPSELAPLSAFVLAEIIHAAGLPAGVFNLVTGPGPIVGEHIVTHPEVDMVTFTGSTRTGRRLAELAAPQVKPLALELGGKSANVWLDDVDIAKTAPDAVFKAFVNSGQTCIALTRLLVPRSRLAEAEQAIAAVVSQYTTGDPLSPATQLGPLINKAAREKVLSYIDIGLEEGARLLTGGPGKVDGVERGYYVQPTVFTDVSPTATIAQEEIFGPVLAIIAYDTEDEAVAIANNSPYGLYGAVSSADPRRAGAIAARIHTGSIEINGAAFNPLAPFGGVKQSGHGREYGVWGFDEFTTVKAISY